MSANNICSWCNGAVESSLHVLRDCTDTGQLWGFVINTRYQWDFFNLRTIDDWISWNLKQGKKPEFQMNNGLFMVLCWNIWKRRNERIFEGKSRFNECIIAQAKGMMSCLERVQTKTSSINWHGNGIQNCDLRWKPPETSWVSLCVDGAFSMTQQTRGCGGLLRNSAGQFITGFSLHLDEGDHLSAELWAILIGLKIAWDAGVRKIVVESDSAEAISLTEVTNYSIHPDCHIIMEIQSMIHRAWEIRICQISRDANVAADHLAKQALDAWPGLHILSFPTESLRRCMDSTCTVNESRV